jgi:hypothetical protein
VVPSAASKVNHIRPEVTHGSRAPGSRLRGRATLLGALFIAAAVLGACLDPPTTPRVERRHDVRPPEFANAYVYEPITPPYPCVIGYFPPPGYQTFFGIPFSVVDSVCNIWWTAWSKPFSTQFQSNWGLMFQEWIPTSGERNTLFSVSSYGDIQNGPLQFTFDRPVTNFTLTLYGVDSAGHAMTAYDRANKKIDTVTFLAPDTAQTLVLRAKQISKVVIYAPLGPPDANGDRAQVDFVFHRAGFEADTNCPPINGEPLLNVPTVRKAIKDALDSSSAYAIDASQRRERSFGVYRDKVSGDTLIYWLRPTPSTTPCEGYFGDPIQQPGYDLLGWFHTHPFKPPGYYGSGERTPSNCRPEARNRRYRPEPSEPDWTTGINDARVESYFIDKYVIGAFHPEFVGASDAKSRPSMTKYYRWYKPLECTW